MNWKMKDRLWEPAAETKADLARPKQKQVHPSQSLSTSRRTDPLFCHFPSPYPMTVPLYTVLLSFVAFVWLSHIVIAMYPH